jgi:hypothetical protein
MSRSNSPSSGDWPRAAENRLFADTSLVRYARHERTLQQVLPVCQKRNVTEREPDSSKTKLCNDVFGGCQWSNSCTFSHHPAMVAARNVKNERPNLGGEADYWGKSTSQLWLLAWGDVKRHSELLRFVESKLASKDVHDAHTWMVAVAKDEAEKEEEDNKKRKEHEVRRQQEALNQKAEEARKKEAIGHSMELLKVLNGRRKSLEVEKRFDSEFVAQAVKKVVEPARLAAGADPLSNFNLLTALVGESDGGTLHWTDDTLETELVSNAEVLEGVTNLLDAFWFQVLLEQGEACPSTLDAKRAKKWEETVDKFSSWRKANAGNAKQVLGPLFRCLSQAQEKEHEVPLPMPSPTPAPTPLQEREHEEQQVQDHEQEIVEAVCNWKVDNVCAWFAEKFENIPKDKLDVYVAMMRESGIDGKMLVTLTDDDLGDLGITNKFHRRSVLAELLPMKSTPTKAPEQTNKVDNPVAFPITTAKKTAEKKADLGRPEAIVETKADVVMDAVTDAISRTRSAEVVEPKRRVVHLNNILKNVAPTLVIALFAIEWRAWSRYMKKHHPTAKCACNRTHHDFSDMSSTCIYSLIHASAEGALKEAVKTLQRACKSFLGEKLLAVFDIATIAKLSRVIFDRMDGGHEGDLWWYQIDGYGYPVQILVTCRNADAHDMKWQEYDIERLEQYILRAEEACRALAAKLKHKGIEAELVVCAKSLTDVELDKAYDEQITSRAYLQLFNMQPGVQAANQKRAYWLSEMLTKWVAGENQRLILQLVIPPVDPARLFETRDDLEYLRYVRWDKVLDLSSSNETLWPSATWDFTDDKTAEQKYCTAISRFERFVRDIYGQERLVVFVAVPPPKDLGSNKLYATVAEMFADVVQMVTTNRHKPIAEAATQHDAATGGPWRELLIGDATYFHLNQPLAAEYRKLAKIDEKSLALTDAKEALGQVLCSIPFLKAFLAAGRVSQFFLPNWARDSITPIDATSWHNLANTEDIEILHKNIETEGLTGDDEPDAGGEVYTRLAQRFALEGTRAHWALFQDDLKPNQCVVYRQQVAEIVTRLKGRENVVLQHAYGSGGTTFARHVLFRLRNDAVCVAVYKISIAKLETLIGLLKGFVKETGLPLVVLLDLPEECDAREAISTKLSEISLLLECEHFSEAFSSDKQRRKKDAVLQLRSLTPDEERVRSSRRSEIADVSSK